MICNCTPKIYIKMKKISLCGGALMLSLVASSSVIYDKMNFTTTDGTSYEVPAEGLCITVEGENLSIVAKDRTITIPLASLSTMQFVDNLGFIDSLTSASDDSVTVYGLDGVSVGTYSSAAKAMESLSAGIYLMKDNEGKTFKIKVEK